MSKYSKKLTPAQRRKVAVLRIEAKRRENFDKDLAKGFGVANIKGSGAFTRNTHPPALMRPSVKYATEE